jgi:hypothetical protein
MPFAGWGASTKRISWHIAHPISAKPLLNRTEHQQRNSGTRLTASARLVESCAQSHGLVASSRTLPLLLHGQRDHGCVLRPARVARNRHRVIACRSARVPGRSQTLASAATSRLEQASAEYQEDDTESEEPSAVWLIQSRPAEQHGRDHQTERKQCARTVFTSRGNQCRLRSIGSDRESGSAGTVRH